MPPIIELYPQPDTDFPELKRLQLARLMNVHQVRGCRRLAQMLIPVAQQWLPYSIVNDNAYTPYGIYIWHFAVELEQERRWNFPEFQAGYDHAVTAEQPCRTSPYPRYSGKADSWDKGYIYGLMIRHGLADLSRLKPAFRPPSAAID